MVVVITGASGGIGRSVVAKMLSREFKVLALVKNKIGEASLLDYLAKKNVRVYNLYLICADFCDASAIGDALTCLEDFYKEFGEFGAFINCAGCYFKANNKTKDLNTSVNFTSALKIFYGVKPLMKNEARVIFLVPRIRKFDFVLNKPFMISNLFLINDIINLAKKGDNLNYYFYSPRQSNTNFYSKNARGVLAVIGAVRKGFSMPPEYSAEQIVHIALRKEYAGVSGGFYFDNKIMTIPRVFDNKKFKELADKFSLSKL
ncbi:MAG: SDR family NAD(P)-dependent oxidoreductase [Clostridia bacterium]|nr:SDR family NAD(P)-dependent oxidoreductase [Clostridia bacterium]